MRSRYSTTTATQLEQSSQTASSTHWSEREADWQPEVPNMSRRQENPFNDILQPQPRHHRQPLQDDPFGDNDVDLMDDEQPGASQGHQYQGRISSDQPSGAKHGYALDPFFDE